MKIIVLKTNLQNEEQKKIITPIIKQIKGITRWTIDFEDIDKVLRIEGHGLKPEQIETDIIKAGFECEIMY